MESDVPGIQSLIVAGEPCPPEVARTWSQGRSFFNAYGPTESTVCATTLRYEGGRLTIGKPIANMQVFILDRHNTPQPIGVPGELCIGGVGVAREYLNRPKLTAEKFIRNPFGPGRLYKTGDLARWLPDGNIESLGRIDNQVKIRGFRIELGEIESALREHAFVRGAVVNPFGEGGEKRLCAYIVGDFEASELRHYLGRKLPDYMVPAVLMKVDNFPLTPSGKIDRKHLPTPEIATGSVYAPPRTEQEKILCAVFMEILNVPVVGINDNFFELGGTSLLLVRARKLANKRLPANLAITDFFQYPTIARLAEHLSGESAQVRKLPVPAPVPARDNTVAVIGMAGHFPGATNAEEFWDNLASGVESITFFNEEELLDAGYPLDVIRDPHFVPALGRMDGMEYFDPTFFNMTPREAALIDPQQRHLLEVAWETLENAGCNPDTYKGRIGVFVGIGTNSYMEENLLPSLDDTDVAGSYQVSIMNGKDFAATRLSYRLNLTGPSVNVNTTCSTSLVAVHMAARAILDGQCEMALAGGAKIQTHRATGYFYRDGFILSPDGHCRAFDKDAKGTVGGCGAGMVALKRLSAAIDDGDPILAVIKGSAINNDGSDKVGFTAPSVAGQAEVIRQAQRTAGVEPRSINYIEAHGTATNLGDPIEIRALSEAFGDTKGRLNYCAVGSVKSNIGHLDAAAGIASMIKTIKALEHGQIPATLHFKAANPAIDLRNSPFFIADRLMHWTKGPTPRRAGVSSFGIGGTNAHVILEEAPVLEPAPANRPDKLLLLSAHNESALDRVAAKLARHLERYPDTDLDNAAFTLAVGRKKFGVRRALTCRDIKDAITQLRSDKFFTSSDSENTPDVAFMFTGQGSQRLGMGHQIYLHEPVFREVFDRCAEILKPCLGADLRSILWNGAGTDLTSTRLAQPAIFSVEYALARLWMEWGVKPVAMIGHSIGEWTAACLAGVFSLEDALALVALRGKLMDEQKPGGMLAVQLSQTDTLHLLKDGLNLAAVNARNQCVVSGPQAQIDKLEEELRAAGRQVRKLDTSHAFHSHMMEPAMAPFAEALEKVEMRTPRIPFISNLTGAWILDEQATSPEYWVKHIRKPVYFYQGMGALLQTPRTSLLEVGPDAVLSHMAARHPSRTRDIPVISSLQGGKGVDDQRSLLEAAGALWMVGAAIDWNAYYAHQKRRRIALPTYPFERKRCWIEAPGHESVRIGSKVKTKVLEPRTALVENAEIQKGAPSINPTEAMVIHLMTEVLGVEGIKLNDDFFQLGGDSLTAVQLATKLEKTLDVILPRNVLMESPTPARLAMLIDANRSTVTEQEKPAAVEGIHQFARGNPGLPPIFLIPAIGGGAFIYRELAAALKLPNPIYALEAPGLWDGGTPLSSVGELAGHFLTAIQKVYSHGDFHLIGSSFGGMVAFELSRRLVENGTPPLRTILIDSPGPGHLPRPFNSDEEILAYLLAGDDPGGLFERNLEELKKLPEDKRLLFVAQKLGGKEEGSEVMSLEEMANIVAVYKANIKAMFAYQAQSYAGKLIFFKAKEADGFMARHPELAWVPLAEGGMEIIPTPGNHANMLSWPQVEKLAAAIAKRCSSRA